MAGRAMLFGTSRCFLSAETMFSWKVQSYVIIEILSVFYNNCEFFLICRLWTYCFIALVHELQKFYPKPTNKFFLPWKSGCYKLLITCILWSHHWAFKYFIRGSHPASLQKVAGSTKVPVHKRIKPQGNLESSSNNEAW